MYIYAVFAPLSSTGRLRTLCQLPRTRGSQNVTFRLLPPTRAGEVPPQAAERAKTEGGEKTYKYTKFTTPTLKIPSRAGGAKRTEKTGSKEKKAKTKNL